MKNVALKQALDVYVYVYVYEYEFEFEFEFEFDAESGVAWRDKEESRAKERIFTVRSADHQWDQK
jgi:hypothetical protein